MLPGPTARLRFRAWDEGDGPLARALWGDPDVMRYLSRAPFDDAACAARLAVEIASQVEHGLAYWPIFRVEDDAHVGCAGLKPSVFVPGSLELGFHLRAPFWGQGLASEAAAAMIAHAWARGETSVCAGHHPENEGSRRVLTRLGFRYTNDVLYPPTGLQHPCYRLDRGTR